MISWLNLPSLLMAELLVQHFLSKEELGPWTISFNLPEHPTGQAVFHQSKPQVRKAQKRVNDVPSTVNSCVPATTTLLMSLYHSRLTLMKWRLPTEHWIPTPIWRPQGPRAYLLSLTPQPKLQACSISWFFIFYKPMTNLMSYHLVLRHS